MTDSEREFRIRPGKPRSTRAPQAKSFVNQVLRAAQKAGHTRSPGASRSSGRSSGSAPSTFGRGHSKFGRSRLFASNRRVIVKARIARHKGRAFRAAPMAAHLAYLKREGVSRDGERGIMFDAETDRADDLGFARRSEGDRHHFRFIVSPEDAADMEDLIPAALITGIRSDLPGQITAKVTQNVYDSPTGSLLLIPQGTRIIGEYDNGVAFGQRRVLLVWSRLIFPDGRSIVLERQTGADASGYAGLEDGVNYHWWDLMKAAGLSTLLAVGAELATSDEDRLIRAIRDGGQDTINQAGQQIVQRQLQVKPTLTIRPGFPFRVIVSRDLILEPYGAS